jgi:hypothetical protein
MSQLNATPPNLPLAPEEYDRRYQEQLNAVLRLYFNQISNPGPLGGASINLSIKTMPTTADFANLRTGDVFVDTSGGVAISYPLRIKS